MSDLSQIPTDQLLQMLQQHATPLTPEQIGAQKAQQAIHGAMTHGFGTGVPQFAQNLGANVTDIAAKALPPEVAAGLGTAANVTTQAIPMLFGGSMSAQAAAPAMQGMARATMQSAIKPTLSDLASGDAARAIDTMLQQGYNPTKGGVAAMQQKIGELGDEISQAIANSPATIDKTAVASRLYDSLSKFSKQVNPQSDIKAIENAWAEFLSHPELAGKATMPVQLAQQMKQGTYQILGDKPYGELAGASTEAQKQLARGLKEEISSAVPEVAPLNELQAALINAKNVAQRRALMQGNINPMSLGWLANNPEAAIGFAAEKSSLLKSMLARQLYNWSKAIPYMGGAAVEQISAHQGGQ